MDNITRQASSGMQNLSAIGALVALGIVFGDIGTSPLYVMKAILHTNPNYSIDYIIGAVSCVIWTLTLQTTLKYVVIALKADNKGEGGILALYALLRRYKRKWLYIVAILGASSLVADGVITPSITVTSAIEGLTVLNPDTPVMLITLIIISIVFFVQQFGTGVIGKMFGPFMFFWFLMLGVFGSMHLVQYPLIIKAFNPYYAVALLIHNPEWFLILGAVFLCTTGAEALYSDLGHCGRKNITVSWIYVKTTLILNYLGQGAWMIANIGHINSDINPFYAIVPNEMLIFSIIMATGAAIIACQALISGSFTIFSVAMNLDFWPQLRIKYPTNIKGQMFIPMVNVTLFIFCAITIMIFQTSSRMEAAYGLAIIITMLMTTVLLTFYLRMKGVPLLIELAFMSFYFVIEGVFFIANLSKFVHGGWFTMILTLVFSIIMLTWYHARRIRMSYLGFKRLDDYYNILSDIKADTEIPKYASNLVYINNSDKEGMVEDKLIYSIINKQPKRADHYWLFHITRDDEPNTLEYTCTPLIPGTLYSINANIGFCIQPHISIYLRQIVQDMMNEGLFDITSGYPSLRKRSIPGDFKFILIHRIYYPSSANNNLKNAVMNLYSVIKRLGVSDVRAFGLDTTNVMVEKVPLIIHGRKIPIIKKAELEVKEQQPLDSVN